MKEARFYKTLNKDKKLIQCQLCPHFCTVKPNASGQCLARKNINGVFYSLVYAKPCAIHVDPIEKKPLYHFLPGSKAFSIGTFGCNLHCMHCQNWEISQSSPADIQSGTLEPREVVAKAKLMGCESIAYTYNEPFIFYEYMLATAKLAKRAGIKNVAVTNGFVNPEPLYEMCKYLDAANVDLKSFSKSFYQKLCKARLEPVLNTIQTLHKKKIWLEITNLIIPSLNSNAKSITRLCKWIYNKLGADVPVHFSAFYPCYKLLNKPQTPLKMLLDARNIAIKTGIKYVYTGNTGHVDSAATYCAKCHKPLIKRGPFGVFVEYIKNKKCALCKTPVAGVWD